MKNNKQIIPNDYIMNHKTFIKFILNDDQKKYLIENYLKVEEADDFSYIKEIALTNDYNKDDIFDNRDIDFWENGIEYPYCWVILCDDNYYDSITNDMFEKVIKLNQTHLKQLKILVNEKRL